jgi:Stage II sporulation protein E (SpoIIE)
MDHDAACVLVSDGVTEALDGEPLENDLNAVNGRLSTAAAVCETLLVKALAGGGPAGDPDWDDDRTVLVALMNHS